MMVLMPMIVTNANDTNIATNTLILAIKRSKDALI